MRAAVHDPTQAAGSPRDADQRDPPQHPRCAWTGGHCTEPNEQKTQQSPGFGRSKVPQLRHS